ncbi:DUF3024 domain-containing protein [Amycolatopsis arida]|uniref:DUF3024 domain-containing protein n=1 Tax=Amycolatopsis arida TaxID=587909 RepID=UPI000B89FD2F|nr:DUF3024 domain-containing protein [Amycolatopsis arida]
MAAISEFALRQIERWCARRVPDTVREQLRFECRRRGRSVTLVQRRLPWTAEPGSTAEWIVHEFAQLRLGDDGRWSLYWRDRGGRWRPYPGCPSAPSPVPLLEEIDLDPEGRF